MTEVMKEVGASLFWVAFFIGVPAYCLCLVANGVRTGVVRAKGFPYSRSKSPYYFWATIVTYGAIASGIGTVAVVIGVEMFRGR